MNQLLKVTIFMLPASLVLALPAAQADYLYWNQTTDGQADVASNWTCTFPAGNPSKVPGDGDTVVIKMPGVVLIPDNPLGVFAGSPDRIWVGDGAGIDTSTEPYSPYAAGAGHMLQTGGSVGFGSHLYVGNAGAPGVSTYEMQGGSLTQVGEGKSVIGHAGATGEFTVHDATINTYGDFQIGFDSAASVGTFTLSGDSHFTMGVGQFQVGSVGGTGTVRMSGASSIDTTAGWTYIGLLNWATATLEMSGQSTFRARNTTVAYDLVTSSTITLDEGAVYEDLGTMSLGYCGTPADSRTDIQVTVKGNATLSAVDLHVGLYKGADATMTVSSTSATPTDTAKVNATGSLNIGYVGGKGNLTIGDRGVVTHGAGDVNVGVGIHDGIVGEGKVTIDNGGVFDNTASTGTILVGGDGNVGLWTQNGGTLLNAQGVALGYNAGTATLNLNGGVFEAAFVRTDDSVAAPVNSTLNFNGGTLKAAADNTNFVGDSGTAPILNANVQSGGARIDTNGFDVVINSALVEDGDSPGGGLTKLGLGTLTLGGANTYTGETSIEAGTLSITDDESLADGSILSIALGAVMDLNFTGADRIAQLYLNGVSQVGGTWGATGSGATHVDDTYFTGTGLIEVLSILIPGDTNGDLIVDAFDASALAQYWGDSVSHGDHTKGDFNADGVVNAADASILAANWGDHRGEGASSVPEPGIPALLLGLGLTLCRRWTRRQ